MYAPFRPLRNDRASPVKPIPVHVCFQVRSSCLTNQKPCFVAYQSARPVIKASDSSSMTARPPLLLTAAHNVRNTTNPSSASASRSKLLASPALPYVSFIYTSLLRLALALDGFVEFLTLCAAVKIGRA